MEVEFWTGKGYLQTGFNTTLEDLKFYEPREIVTIKIRLPETCRLLICNSLWKSRTQFAMQIIFMELKMLNKTRDKNPQIHSS